MTENRLAVLILSFFIFSLTLVLSSHAEPIKEHLPPKSMLLDDPSWTIVVVTVEKAQEQNTDLSKGSFFVDEVLRGRLKKDYVQLMWRPPNIKPRGLQAGDKLIVFVLPNRDKLHSNIDAEVTEVYKFSNASRETVLANMAPPERTAPIQLPLLLMVLLTPIVLVLFGKSRSRMSFFLLILQFISYFIYESGISIYSNIRIDLLLVYPALLASIIIVLSHAAKRRTSQ